MPVTVSKAASRYVAADGELLDEIAWRHYGRQDGGVVEKVLEANPGLIAGAELSAGDEVLLPYVDFNPIKDGVKLWG